MEATGSSVLGVSATTSGHLLDTLAISPVVVPAHLINPWPDSSHSILAPPKFADWNDSENAMGCRDPRPFRVQLWEEIEEWYVEGLKTGKFPWWLSLGILWNIGWFLGHR